MLNIGKIIFSKLRHLVANRVFPLIAEQGTEYPFIIYSRTVGLPSDSKDMFVYKLRNTVEIKVVSETYDEGVKIAGKVFEIFDNMREKKIDDTKIAQTRIQSVSESYSDVYIQNVTVTIDTE